MRPSPGQQQTINRGNCAMDDASRAHTLRVYSVRSAVDDTILPSNKEQPMFAYIRQWSRYILISG